MWPFVIFMAQCTVCSIGYRQLAGKRAAEPYCGRSSSPHAGSWGKPGIAFFGRKLATNCANAPRCPSAVKSAPAKTARSPVLRLVFGGIIVLGLHNKLNCGINCGKLLLFRRLCRWHYRTAWQCWIFVLRGQLVPIATHARVLVGHRCLYNGEQPGRGQ